MAFLNGENAEGRLDERSAERTAYARLADELFAVQWDLVVGSGRGTIITDPPVIVATGDLDHAGGLQIADGILAVGAEDDDAKDRSQIRFYDVRDPSAFDLQGHLTFTRPGPGQTPRHERWTAGAVGLVKTADRYTLVVGSWNSDELDFYCSTSDDLRDTACTFQHVGSWSKHQADKSDWIDDNWEGYQSLNLVVGSRGRLFLIGGHRGGIGGHTGSDWLDLYELHLDRPAIRRVAKVGKRHMTCHDGASFRWGGGIVSEGQLLHAIATEADLKSTTKINLFEGPGGIGHLDMGAGFIANRNSGETHSRLHPCAWVSQIAGDHRVMCSERPEGFHWCDYCFPDRADG